MECDEAKSSSQASCGLKSTASDEDMFAEDQEDYCADKTWRGAPLSDLPRISSQCLFPPVVPSAHHSVLFKLPVNGVEVPEPWPRESVDVWDQNHVRMPHSKSSLYPVTETELRRRWELVRSALSSPITSCSQLEAAILHYNSKYSERWDFSGLRTFFDETLEEVETEYFFSRVLPKVIDLALSLPDQLTGGLPLLRRHTTRSISLSQKQISCLLANAFLCTFPRRNTSKKNSEYCSFPDINFNRLFSGDGRSSRESALQEKLKCLINYFRRVTKKVPEGVVTYSRHHVPSERLPDWASETCRLPALHVASQGTIEDNGTGLLQMDFANKFVGGGVLGRGCVQEEIRFVICPELVLARLFTEVLDDTEALIVSGCERFSDYRGYAETFEWAGNAEDTTPRDRFGRRACAVVAIDAFRFSNAKTQYGPAKIGRELNKAYAGFSWGCGEEGGGKGAVATGNWGCGAFGGDAFLKALVQLMAAAKAQRAVAYFTFGDKELMDRLADMHRFLTDNAVTVGRLWKVITSYNPLNRDQTLYDHIYHCILNKTIPTALSVGSFYSQCPKKPRVEEERGRTPEKRNGLGKRLDHDEIVKALEAEEEAEGAKPLEAKTLSIQKDKDLCLKRLSSSWTNLNESKKDFRPDEVPKSPESAPTSKSALDDRDSHIGVKGSLSRQSLEPNKKKKISDFFHPVPKPKSW